MGFRFINQNSLHKSHQYLSKFTPKTRKDSIFTLQNHPTIQPTITLFQVQGNYHPPNFLNPPNCHIFKRWHFGHSHHGGHRPHHHHQGSSSSLKSENVFKLGLAADIGLTAGKALTGYLSGSTAIIADAAHSLSDVVLSTVALLSFKAARVPRDKEHPYGYYQLTSTSVHGMVNLKL